MSDENSTIGEGSPRGRSGSGTSTESVTIQNKKPTKEEEKDLEDVKEALDEADKDDFESNRAFAGWFRQFTYPSMESLDQRIKRSSKRLMQSGLFFKLVDDRLAQLERNMRIVMKQPEPVVMEQSAIPKNKPEIKRMGWSEFSAQIQVNQSEKPSDWKHVPEYDLSPKNVIEILTEEANIYEGPIKSNVYRQADVVWSSGSYALPTEGSAGPEQENKLPVPHWIRIRSPVLLKILSEITPFNCAYRPHRHLIVFIQPFKLLIKFADDIFQHTKYLENRHAPKAVGGSTATASPTPPINSRSEEEVLQPPRPPEIEIKGREALEHLRLLSTLLQQDLAPVLRTRDEAHSGNLHKVSFNNLWHIFRPGQEVRRSGDNEMQLYRVVQVTGGRDILHPIKQSYDTRNLPPPPPPPGGDPSLRMKNRTFSEGSFLVECMYIDFDGTQYGPVNETFQIRKYDGEKEVSSLPIYPFNCDPNQHDLREYLLERGKQFIKLANPTKTAHMQYEGLTLDEHQEQVESQVIVDLQLAFSNIRGSRPRIGLDDLVNNDSREVREPYFKCAPYCTLPGCCGNDCLFQDYVIDESEVREFKSQSSRLLRATEDATELEDDQIVLLPGRVLGFVLRSRKWATFNLDRISDVQFTNGWKDLVIPEQIRSTVLAMVENHESFPDKGGSQDFSHSSVDLVRGKGKGLIILLHGEPGVGKTSTAECVADHTKRPLFPITCGDIGDNAESVEDNLEENFQLAHRWGCVLLLDEADVFLKERDANLTRNAIVSVFLRTLEYYSGILFLTTNRVGQIDRAFKSRIHVSLHYPKLDKDSSVQIWRNNLSRIEKDFKDKGRDITIEKREIIKYSKEHFKTLKKEKLLTWNGRQIRNAFQTALALSHYDAEKNRTHLILCRQQFEQVAKAAKEFDEYLKSVYFEKDDAQLAREHHWRDDDWAGESYHSPRANPIRMRGHSPPRYRRGMNARPTQRVEESPDSSSYSSSEDEEDEKRNENEDNSSSESSSEEDLKQSRKGTSSKTKSKSKSSSSKAKIRDDGHGKSKTKSKSRKGKEKDTD